jgi:hypothetical protein
MDGCGLNTDSLVLFEKEGAGSKVDDWEFLTFPPNLIL